MRKLIQSSFQAGGDGGSSTSESSLGSSSGYGSQSTVRVPANEVVAENQLQPPNNSHQPTLTAVHDGNYVFRVLKYFMLFMGKMMRR